MEAESVKALEGKLAGICGHQKCLGREAMLEAARWVVDEPAGWILEKDEDRLWLYAIIGSTVHSLSADCAPPTDPALAAPETATCDYVVLEPLTGGEYVRSAVEVTEGGPAGDPPSACADWLFELGRPLSVRYQIGADTHAHDFSVALLAAIVAAREASPHR